ncbi:hypothetical protein [Flavobacterium sp. DSR3-2]
MILEISIELFIMQIGYATKKEIKLMICFSAKEIEGLELQIKQSEGETQN